MLKPACLQQRWVHSSDLQSTSLHTGQVRTGEGCHPGEFDWRVLGLLPAKLDVTGPSSPPNPLILPFANLTNEAFFHTSSLFSPGLGAQRREVCIFLALQTALLQMVLDLPVNLTESLSCLQLFQVEGKPQRSAIKDFSSWTPPTSPASSPLALCTWPTECLMGHLCEQGSSSEPGLTLARSSASALLPSS